jgi:hypothetical protein
MEITVRVINSHRGPFLRIRIHHANGMIGTADRHVPGCDLSRVTPGKFLSLRSRMDNDGILTVTMSELGWDLILLKNSGRILFDKYRPVTI